MCFTDAASALIKAPDIKKNVVFVLIGANDPDRYRDAGDFNLRQDIPAARAIMDSDAMLLLLPAMGGTQCLELSLGECAYALEGRGIPAGDYLTHLIRRDHGVPLSGSSDGRYCCRRSRCISRTGCSFRMSAAFIRRIVSFRTVCRNVRHFCSRSFPQRCIR